MEVEMSKKLSLATFGLFHFAFMISANNSLYLIKDCNSGLNSVLI